PPVGRDQGASLPEEPRHRAWGVPHMQRQNAHHRRGLRWGFSSTALLVTGLYLVGTLSTCRNPRNCPSRPVVDCSESPTAAMTQDYLRPCLTNTAFCLQAVHMLTETPALAAMGGGVRD